MPAPCNSELLAFSPQIVLIFLTGKVTVSCSFSPSLDACALTFTQPLCVTHSSRPLVHFLRSPRTLVKGCFRPQRQLGLRSTLVNFQLYILMGTSGILMQARPMDDLVLWCMHDSKSSRPPWFLKKLISH